MQRSISPVAFPSPPQGASCLVGFWHHMWLVLKKWGFWDVLHMPMQYNKSISLLDHLWEACSVLGPGCITCKGRSGSGLPLLPLTVCGSFKTRGDSAVMKRSSFAFLHISSNASTERLNAPSGSSKPATQTSRSMSVVDISLSQFMSGRDIVGSISKRNSALWTKIEEWLSGQKSAKSKCINAPRRPQPDFFLATAALALTQKHS